MLSFLSRALRNVSIIRWWANCSPEMRAQIRREYAARLGCDPIELGDNDTFIQDEDVLAWVWTAYPNTVAAWEDDQM